MNDTARFWEGSVPVLSADHPINGSLQSLVINEDVRFGLVEGFDNKGRQPLDMKVLIVGKLFHFITNFLILSFRNEKKNHSDINI